MRSAVEIVFTDRDGTLIPLVLDAAPEEQHQAGALATEHAVEAGAEIADHVRAQRRLLSLEVVISDTPVYSHAGASLSPEAVELELPGRLHGTAPKWDGEDWTPGDTSERAAPETKLEVLGHGQLTRVADAWRILMDARARSLIAIVTTRYDTYENAALVDLTATRTAADGTWLRASLVFAELRFVSTQLVDDPVPLRPRDRRQVDLGSREPTPIPQRDVSVLLQGARSETGAAVLNFLYGG